MESGPADGPARLYGWKIMAAAAGAGLTGLSQLADIFTVRSSVVEIIEKMRNPLEHITDIPKHITDVSEHRNANPLNGGYDIFIGYRWDKSPNGDSSFVDDLEATLRQANAGQLDVWRDCSVDAEGT